MATTLVIQRLQKTFVGPTGPHDPLPNPLHIGQMQASRLAGPAPPTGPLAQLTDSDAIDLVHIRDRHDPAAPQQRGTPAGQVPVRSVDAYFFQGRAIRNG